MARDAIRDHPANARLIDSLRRKSGGAVTVVAPDAVRDPYYECGSHPEIVERIWDQLGRGLPPSCRCILCGTPVLVHSDTGLVLAVGSGTRYCLRIPDGVLPAALQAGWTTSHRWGNEKVTDLSVEFGPDWVFGRWAKDEAVWCQACASGDTPA
jgi:hypothetical protein